MTSIFSPRILIIRRDNIGDLVCTLPFIRRLRQHYPQAWIGALVTSYTVEVLRANPDLNAVFYYTKTKHLTTNESTLKTILYRLRLLWQLRQKKIDIVLLPATGTQTSSRWMAKLIGAKRILTQHDAPNTPMALHEVDRTANLLRALDIPQTQLPPPQIYPRTDLLAEVQAQFSTSSSVLGLHISARKPSQRWPTDRFIELIQRLNAQSPELHIALFWSPGTSDNPLHPGDDTKAQEIIAACASCSITPIPAPSLAELIAGLAVCSKIICSDGGHMHLAAALNKPIVCLFGKSDTIRWPPWRVPYQLIQPESLDVCDVSVDRVLSAFSCLPD